MVAAIDWCSHTTHDWIWLASCFGFNGPLRQYFRLNRTVSRKREQEKTKDRRKKKMSKQSRATPYAIRPCPTFIQISGTPRH